MAEGRVLKRYISTSEKVNNLPYETMLIYTWCIPHTDDLGLLPASPRKLRAIVAPMWDMTVNEFGNHVDAIRKAGLFTPVTISGQEYFYLVGHSREQSIKRKDRKPNSMAVPLRDWDEWESELFRLENLGNTNGSTMKCNVIEKNVIEGKGSGEGNIIETLRKEAHARIGNLSNKKGGSRET